MLMTVDDRGVRVGDGAVDVTAGDAAERLRALLGPVENVHVFEGVGRTAQVLRGGIVLLVADLGDAGDELLSISVCFDAADGSPYSFFATVPVFAGTVACGDHRFSGGEPESVIDRVPGLHGFGGALSFDVGDVHLGLWLKKPRDPFGKRRGRRRLVHINFEWGPVKAFPPRK